MSDKTLEDDVRTFYESESLAKERVSAILDVSAFAATARRWKQTAIATSIGLAAMTLFAIGLFLQSRDTQSTNSSIAGNSESSASFRADNTVQSEAQVSGLDEQDYKYRLVAFRSHGDGCPHCRATGEVFEQLTVALQDQTIATEQFDLSQSNERPAITNRLEELNLTPLIKGRIETAFLALVSKDGTQIREFKPSMKSERIASAVRELVTE